MRITVRIGVWMLVFAATSVATPLLIGFALDYVNNGSLADYKETFESLFALPYVFVGSILAAVVCPFAYLLFRAGSVAVRHVCFLNLSASGSTNLDHVLSSGTRHLLIGLAWLNSLRIIPLVYLSNLMSVDISDLLLDVFVAFGIPFNLLGVLHIAAAVRRFTYATEAFGKRSDLPFLKDSAGEITY